MLKPFQIRDLHRSSSQDDLSGSLNLNPTAVEDRLTRPQGIVRLSATEYDELAINHPRARLTYIDNDDDDELITVGSSLELSQRLEEPVDASVLSQPTLQSITPEPMHIFDIRRSNSVKNLWKKFEYQPQLEDRQNKNEIGAGSATTGTPQSKDQEISSSSRENPGPATTADPEPLLAAFEAEMAKILSATETVRDGNDQPEPPVETPTRRGSDRRQCPSDALLQALQNLVDGAELISAGVRSRLPEFERQLQNVQRTLPEHVGSSVQVALAALDSQARSLVQALNNASAVGGQRAGNLFQNELPTPAATMEGLRNMASELGNMGHTLFEAFESEFRCSTSRDQGQHAPGENTRGPVSGLPQPTESATSAPENITATKSEAQRSAYCENAKEPPSTETRDAPSTHIESRQGSLGEDSVLPTDRDTNLAETRQQPGSSSPTLSSTPDNQAPFSSSCNRPYPLPHRPHPSSRNVQAPFITPSTRYPLPPFPVPPPLPPVFWPHHGPPPHPPPPPHASHPHPHPFHPHAPPHHIRHPQPHPRGPSHASHRWPFHTPTSAVPQPPWPHFPRRGWPASQLRRNDDGAPANEAVSHPGHESPFSSTLSAAGTSLFIGNVGFGVHEAMIHDVFASKGFLVDVYLPLDAETGRHAGFGYLHFPSTHAANAALDALQGAHIDGHSINLEISDHSPITTLHTAQGQEEASNQPSELQSSSITPAEARQVSESQISGAQRDSTNDRRVAPLAVADLCSADNRHLMTETSSSDSSLVSSSLLDTERLNTLYPSLLPEGSPRVSNDSSTQLPDPSRELEGRRFPPVSQLDAHFLAEQRGAAESSNDTPTPGPRSTPRGCFSGASHGSSSGSAPRSLPGAFPQVSQDSLQPRPGSLRDTDDAEQTENRDRMPASCRRHRTVRSSHPSRRHLGPWDSVQTDKAPDASRPLRRRATERHSLRDSRQISSTSTFNRPSHRNNATPRPSTSTAESGAVRQRSIDDCVSALASLGYGSAEEGGLQRIAVYAAAVDGRVSDAIEMIEEERKAYEQGSRR
ncbi:hypothetical protein BDV23DRAFT_158707 [Aspergillus alliaceus]|uniref:RRM domain-containing protein n=1 Tax=Petromyces alliaceus TaxID=209559 RepID=A0A5N7C3D6_PETAA|nr:hypothetical protein BDV23DRAFT_158707 [Aspergillus alliaceus]